MTVSTLYPVVVLNPISGCGTEVEVGIHYLLRCPNYLHERKILLKNIKSIFPNILEQSDYLTIMFFTLVIPVSITL